MLIYYFFQPLKSLRGGHRELKTVSLNLDRNSSAVAEVILGTYL
jgi:hypothetical protein